MCIHFRTFFLRFGRPSGSVRRSYTRSAERAGFLLCFCRLAQRFGLSWRFLLLCNHQCRVHQVDLEKCLVSGFHNIKIISQVQEIINLSVKIVCIHSYIVRWAEPRLSSACPGTVPRAWPRSCTRCGHLPQWASVKSENAYQTCSLSCHRTCPEPRWSGLPCWLKRAMN